MATSKKIAVFPEPGAIGPVMNLVGICQALRDLGHECVFILDPWRKGSATGHGIGAQLPNRMAPKAPAHQRRNVDDYMQY